MSKRKSPLREWRDGYATVSFLIRAAKQQARGGHVWGDFKRSRAQSIAAKMKESAREMMAMRPDMVKATQDQWLRRKAAWDRKNIPNTTDPELKVSE